MWLALWGGLFPSQLQLGVISVCAQTTPNVIFLLNYYAATTKLILKLQNSYKAYCYIKSSYYNFFKSFKSYSPLLKVIMFCRFFIKLTIFGIYFLPLDIKKKVLQI